MSNKAPKPRSELDHRPTVILSLVVVAVVLKAILTLRANINWDEFWFLSFVHAYVAKRPVQTLQTVHVHMFAWLVKIPGYEVPQVLTGRGALYLLHISSLVLLYRIGRTFLTKGGALFGLLCAITYSAVILHGASFRTDGIALFLVLLSLTALRSGTRHTPWHLIVALFAFASGVAVTLKALIFAPVILAWLVKRYKPDNWFRLLVLIATAGAMLVGMFALIFFLHRATLVPTHTAGGNPLRDRLADMAFGARTSDTWKFTVRTIAQNLITWILMLFSVRILVGRGLQSKGDRNYLPLTLLLPLISLFAYRNTYPYFFAFIMPPALLLCGVFYDHTASTFRTARPRLARAIISIVVVALLLQAGPTYWRAVTTIGWRQQELVLRATHGLYPSPVPYIDRNGMISSFPKIGPFMSSFGMSAYRANGVPAFAGRLETDQPQLLVANSPALMECEPVPAANGENPYRLLPADAKALCDSFVHLWGPLFVPGKVLDLRGTDTQHFRPHVAGTYEIVAGEALVDGVRLRIGDRVDLTVDDHMIRRAELDRVVIRWVGFHLMPDYAPPRLPMYEGL